MMDEHCRGCIRYLKSCSGLSKDVCEKHQLRIPRTNADRIRSMTDEELADEILSWFNWLNAVEWDDKRIIEWLKQEAET